MGTRTLFLFLFLVWALVATHALTTQAQIRYTPIDAPVPEFVLDDPDMEPVAKLPPKSRFLQAGRTVGLLRLNVTTPEGRQAQALCTAVLVGEGHILTSHHCVPGWLGVRVQSASLAMGYINRGEESREEIFEVLLPPLESSLELDYSILGVAGRPGARYGVARPSRRAARQGEAAFLIHHPEGGPQTITRRNCLVHRGSATDFIHTCDTRWGSSGSPVFSVQTGRMIGMHYAGNRTANYAKQMAAIWAQSALLRSLAGGPTPGDSIEPSAEQGPPGQLTTENFSAAGRDIVASQVRKSLETLAGVRREKPGKSAPKNRAQKQLDAASSFWKRIEQGEKPK